MIVKQQAKQEYNTQAIHNTGSVMNNAAADDILIDQNTDDVCNHDYDKCIFIQNRMRQIWTVIRIKATDCEYDQQQMIQISVYKVFYLNH